MTGISYLLSPSGTILKVLTPEAGFLLRGVVDVTNTDRYENMLNN